MMNEVIIRNIDDQNNDRINDRIVYRVQILEVFEL